MPPDRSPHGFGDSTTGGWAWVGVADSLVGGVVVVLVIALATASQLVRSEDVVFKQNAQLERLRDDLEQAAARADGYRAALDRTEQRLVAAEAEKAALDQKLKAAESAWDADRRRVAALTVERDALATKLVSAAEAAKKATDELTRVAAERDGLRKERDGLAADLKKERDRAVALERKQESLVKELAQATAAVQELAKNRKLLEAQLAEEQQKVAVADKQRKKAEDDLKEVQNKVAALEKERKELKADLERAHDQIAGLKSELADALAKLKLAAPKAEQLDKLVKDYKLSPDEINKLLAKLRDPPAVVSPPKAETIHARLLGINGSLKRVAILLDRSGSMDSPPPGGAKEASRWDYTREVMKTWCQHLDVEECVLIVFSSDVRVYAAGGGAPYLIDDGTERGLTDVTRKKLKELRPFRFTPGGAGDRDAMLKIVDDLSKPSGGTNTLKALEIAYEIEGLTSVLLFTDGMPGVGQTETGNGEKEFLKPIDFKDKVQKINKLCDEQVVALARQKRSIPVNTIGVGYYFEREMAEFLGQVARKTGGTFIGR